MKTKLLLFALISMFLACTTKEKLISITHLGLNVIPAKRADKITDERNGQFKIYRTDPLDENYKATYWLRVFPTKNTRFDSPDFVVSSNLIYDRAKYRWETDSILTITLMNTGNHQSWRWTLIKSETGCKFKKDPE